MYSICDAYTCGMDISTVDGRLMITLFSGVGSQISITALQISAAKSTSVPVKLSGEYSKEKSVSGYFAAYSFNSCAPSVAILMISGFSLRNTCSLCARDVEL